MKEKHMLILGWVATFMSVMMYVSYIPQIMNNLAGNKGDFYPAFSGCSKLYSMGHLWSI